MQWAEIRRQYPNTFVLLGDLVEEKTSETTCRIVAGVVLKVSDNAKEYPRSISALYTRRNVCDLRASQYTGGFYRGRCSLYGLLR